MTYAQAAEYLGLSPEAIRHRARRSGWRTMPGNDGRTLVMVPQGVEPVRTPARTGDQPPVSASDRTSAQDDALTRAHARAERAEADRRTAEQRADDANRRADAAVALADRTLIQLAEAEKWIEAERSRADRAEQAIARERSRADALRERLDTAQAELRQSVEAADQASQHAREAQQMAAALRRDLEAAQIAKADAETEVEEMRRADSERKARGRWARLRAASRGE